ncbi:MAG: VacJ family lipoprotein [Sphingomonadales bacterium]|nr:VacJ family lipoprotein [Sphingomonadales bacterium]
MTLPLSLAALALVGAQPLPADAPSATSAASLPLPAGGVTVAPAVPAAASDQPPPVQSPVTPTAAAPAAPPVPVPAAPTPASSQAGSSEILITARGKPPPGDPLQAINAESFKVVQAVDTAVVAPISKGYQKVLPKPVQDGLHNVLINLTEPIVFVNDVLQLKIGKAFKTLTRFTVNTTLGVGGLVDVAKRKPFKIPYHINGFAYTMGYYGIKPGPFLFVPLLGPTTVRDMIGRVMDLSLLPGVAGKPFNRPVYALTSGALKSIDERLERDDMLTTIQQDCADPYAAERTWYLEKRQAAIEELHGRHVDLMSKLPQCLADGLKAREAARAKAAAAKLAPQPAPVAPGAPVSVPSPVTPVTPASGAAPSPAQTPAPAAPVPAAQAAPTPAAPSASAPAAPPHPGQ